MIDIVAIVQHIAKKEAALGGWAMAGWSGRAPSINLTIKPSDV